VPYQPGMMVQDSFYIHPTLSTGLVTGTIIGNDPDPVPAVPANRGVRAYQRPIKGLLSYGRPLTHG
jgi:hypothetical protein